MREGGRAAASLVVTAIFAYFSPHRFVTHNQPVRNFFCSCCLPRRNRAQRSRNDDSAEILEIKGKIEQAKKEVEEIETNIKTFQGESEPCNRKMSGKGKK